MRWSREIGDDLKLTLCSIRLCGQGPFFFPFFSLLLPPFLLLFFFSLSPEFRLQPMGSGGCRSFSGAGGGGPAGNTGVNGDNGEAALDAAMGPLLLSFPPSPPSLSSSSPPTDGVSWHQPLVNATPRGDHQGVSSKCASENAPGENAAHPPFPPPLLPLLPLFFFSFEIGAAGC